MQRFVQGGLKLGGCILPAAVDCDGIKPRCRNATMTFPSGGWYHIEPSSMQGSWLFRNGSLEGATPDDNMKKRTSMDASFRNQHQELYFVISQSPIIMPIRFIRRPDRRGRDQQLSPSSLPRVMRCRSLGPHAGLVMGNLVPRAWDAGDSESSHYVPNWRNLGCLETHEMDGGESNAIQDGLQFDCDAHKQCHTLGTS